MKKSKLLKPFIIVCGFVVLIAEVILAGRACSQSLWTTPDIIQSATSPDGKYTAYIFESNGGMTTGFIYHVSVLPSDKKLGKGPGNVYRDTSSLNFGCPENIVWLSNSELYVEDYRGEAKRKQQIYGITVTFRSLE